VVKSGNKWWLYDDGIVEEVDESILSYYYGDQTQPDYHAHPGTESYAPSPDTASPEEIPSPNILKHTSMEASSGPSITIPLKSESIKSEETSPNIRSRYGMMDWVRRNSPLFFVEKSHKTQQVITNVKAPPLINHAVSCAAYILFYQQTSLPLSRTQSAQSDQSNPISRL
jgi:hypothetical protein